MLLTKPKIEAKPEVVIDLPIPPGKQKPSNQSTKSTVSSIHASDLSNGKRQMPSPTLMNDPPVSTALMTPDMHETNGNGAIRAKKRVRLTSPVEHPRSDRHFTSLLTPTPSADTLMSSPSIHTNGSGSTLPPTLSTSAWQPRLAPPSSRDVAQSTESIGIPTVVYQDPYYSNSSDVPLRAKMFAGRMFSLKGSTVSDLPDFESSVSGNVKWLRTQKLKASQARYGWEYGSPPPRNKHVIDWCGKEDAEVLAYGDYSHAHQSMLTIPRRAEEGPLDFSTGQANAKEQIRLQILSKAQEQGLRKRAPEYVRFGH